LARGYYNGQIGVVEEEDARLVTNQSQGKLLQQETFSNVKKWMILKYAKFKYCLNESPRNTSAPKQYFKKMYELNTTAPASQPGAKIDPAPILAAR
jgi:hypothetical protein